ncbi:MULTISPECIES: hypothetical protein [Sinorhizobium]|uniref:hypothetical protein n=1 Tax=Sinorhizobium TaxID=28105 RepID=UPI0011A470A5|nr:MULTISPECIES: hypothetical protein [Sinorhizobium]MDW9439243.1 hypothetical protein [Sinorhizobium meliloti]MDW9484066.1 hypothetical protein [Sinorhizobium meliloti]MDX0523519.1 hypothetical protein [Sinorhizobium medicae]MDX0634242.1 hypothetical protein [Sinorhizobium medicae]MQV61382.1 hypothetical protein [Sinorhizobium meliloti]
MNFEKIYEQRKRLKIKMHQQGREPTSSDDELWSRQDFEIYKAVYSERKASKANRPQVLLGMAGDRLRS